MKPLLVEELMGFNGKYLLEVKRPDLYFYEQNTLFSTLNCRFLILSYLII